MSWSAESLKEAARQLKKSRQKESVHEVEKKVEVAIPSVQFTPPTAIRREQKELNLKSLVLVERAFVISNYDFDNCEYKHLGIELSFPVPFYLQYVKVNGFVSSNYAGGGDLTLQIVDRSLPTHCFGKSNYHYMSEPIKLDDRIFPLDNWDCCSATTGSDLLLSFEEPLGEVTVELLIQDGSEIRIQKKRQSVKFICPPHTKLGDLAEAIGVNNDVAIKPTVLSGVDFFVDKPQKATFNFGSRLLSAADLDRCVEVNRKLAVIGKMSNPNAAIEYHVTMQFLIAT